MDAVRLDLTNADTPISITNVMLGTTRTQIAANAVTLDAEGNPVKYADQNIAIQLLRLVAPEDVAKDWEERLRAGGLGYGDLKKALFEHYWEYLAEARAKRSELENNLDHVSQVLKEGAAKARERAATVLDRARKNCGLV